VLTIVDEVSNYYLTMQIVKIFLGEGSWFSFVFRSWSRKSSARLIVGRPGFYSLVESDQRLKRLDFTAILLDVQHQRSGAVFFNADCNCNEQMFSPKL